MHVEAGDSAARMGIPQPEVVLCNVGVCCGDLQSKSRSRSRNSRSSRRRSAHHHAAPAFFGSQVLRGRSGFGSRATGHKSNSQFSARPTCSNFRKEVFGGKGSANWLRVSARQ